MKQVLVVICSLATVIVLFSGCIQNTCVPATKENGRYDVNSDGRVNFQDSGLIYINSNKDENYTYNMTYDMNCDKTVDGVDVDLCWQNRD